MSLTGPTSDYEWVPSKEQEAVWGQEIASLHNRLTAVEVDPHTQATIIEAAVAEVMRGGATQGETSIEIAARDFMAANMPSVLRALQEGHAPERPVPTITKSQDAETELEARVEALRTREAITKQQAIARVFESDPGFFATVKAAREDVAREQDGEHSLRGVANEAISKRAVETQRPGEEFTAAVTRVLETNADLRNAYRFLAWPQSRLEAAAGASGIVAKFKPEDRAEVRETFAKVLPSDVSKRMPMGEESAPPTSGLRREPLQKIIGDGELTRFGRESS